MIEVKPKGVGLIERILKQNFQRAPRSADFDKFISKEQLRLVVLDRIDKNFAYVTDGVHTILTIQANKTEEIRYHPLQRCPTNSYLYGPKSYAYLTFTAITDPSSPEEAHPYSPHHFLKEQYNNFLHDRATFTIKNPSERILIFEWNLALVNISSTGYYAPVIAIRKSKLEAEHNPPSFMALNCVLYEKWLRESMEMYKLNDLRDLKKAEFPQYQNVCMFYYMRGMKKFSSIEKKCTIASIDEAQLLLKHDGKKAKNYILIGKMTGIISFPNGQGFKLDEQRLEEINIRNIEALFNGITLALPQPVEPNQSAPKLWGDSDSDDMSEEESRDEGIRRMEDDMEEEESEEEEDPLKSLYCKELQSKKLRPA